jgi:hypothetical protein
MDWTIVTQTVVRSRDEAAMPGSVGHRATGNWGFRERQQIKSIQKTIAKRALL